MIIALDPKITINRKRQALYTDKIFYLLLMDFNGTLNYINKVSLFFTERATEQTAV